MRIASTWTQSLGNISDMICDVTTSIIGANIIRVSFSPNYYRNRYYAIYINGIWQGNVKPPLVGDWVGLFSPPTGSTQYSVYIADAGDYANYNSCSHIPSFEAEQWEALTASNLQLNWTAQPQFSAVRGDSQLSSIVITGASRVANLTVDPEIPTRGELTYSITTTGSTHIVRWFNSNGNLLAEGSIIGNGGLTCAAMNNSGLSVVCSLTYSADIQPNIAILEVNFPKKYYLNYSTSALTYPRTPEATVLDTGADDYIFLTPKLSSGSYNYDILQVGDDGIVQTSTTAPSDSPLLVNNAPLPPANISISGTAAAPVISWSLGQSGCTYTVYSSEINYCINQGRFALPAPIVTSTDATSATLAALSNYAPVDRSSYITTLTAAFDSAVSAANSNFTIASFAAAVSTLNAALLAAVAAYGTSLGLNLAPYNAFINSACSMLAIYVAAAPTDSQADFANSCGAVYALTLNAIGGMLNRQPSRYCLPNGALPGLGASAGATIGTGSNVLGTATVPPSNFQNSLVELCSPVVLYGTLRVNVRATKSGIQETTDQEISCTFNADGSIHLLEPNAAMIQSISFDTSLTVNLSGQIITDNSLVDAAYVDIYLVALGTPIDLTSPAASIAVNVPDAGYNLVGWTGSCSAASVGFYQIAATTRSAAGQRCNNYGTYIRYLTNVAPSNAANKSGKVIRGAAPQ